MAAGAVDAAIDTTTNVIKRTNKLNYKINGIERMKKKTVCVGYRRNLNLIFAGYKNLYIGNVEISLKVSIHGRNKI